MKRKLLLIVLIAIGHSTIAQIQNQQWYRKLYVPTHNYPSLIQSANTYQQNNPTDTNDKTLKKISRIRSFWQNRVGADGSISSAGKTIALSASGYCANNNGSKWEELGPFTHQVSRIPVDQNVLRREAGIGRIISVACDPNNPDIVFAGSEGGGIFKSSNGGQSWKNVTDAAGLPALAIQDICVDPNNSQKVYAASGFGGYSGTGGYGYGILYSSDGGETWGRVTPTGNFVSEQEALAVKVSPYNGIVFVGIGNRLYRNIPGTNPLSSNAWSLFHTVGSGDMISDIEIVQPNSGIQGYIVYFATRDVHSFSKAKIFKATFTNATLTASGPVSNITPNYSGHTAPLGISIATEKNNSSKLHVIYGGSREFHYRVSSNFGATYTAVKDAEADTNSLYNNLYNGMGKSLGFIQVSPLNPQRVYTSGYQVYHSTNGGADWNLNWKNYHVDIRDMDIASKNGKDVLYIAHDGGLGVSRDHMSSVIDISEGLNVSTVYDVGVSEKTSRILFGMLDNGTAARDNNNEWVRINGGDGGFSFIDRTGDIVINMTNQSITGVSGFTSLINGDYAQLIGKWRNFNVRNYNTWDFDGKQKMIQSRVPPYNVYYTKHGVYEYPMDQIHNTNPVAKPKELAIFDSTNAHEYVIALDISHTTDNVQYAATNTGKLFKTTDKWTTYTLLSDKASLQAAFNKDASGVARNNITDIAVSPFNHNKVWVTFGGFAPANNPSSPFHQRVYLTGDGGNNWTDWSKNLPNVPINSIAIDKNTRIKYVGTDLGIYYFDPLSSNGPNWQWECFNNGLPPVVVNDIEINHCAGKIILGTWGRGIWQNDLISRYNTNSTISSNTVWNTSKALQGNVTIANGGTLTINNAVISISGNRKITVEPGGKLIVNNSTLTAACKDSFWRGIIVKGNAAASQEPGVNNGQYPEQGLVRLSNSTVEFAREAIRTYDPDSWLHQGGMVYAYNSTFRNNKRNAAFRMYENKLANGTVVDYRSGFTKCNFVIDSAFPTDHLPGEHMVTLWRVRGVDFEGCSFKNETGKTLKLQGIYAHNADLLVSEHCSSGAFPCPTANKVKSEFKNLYNGVVATGYGMPYKTTISLANFTQYTNAGIVIDGVDYATIVQNKFDQNNLSSSSTIATKGVYLNNSNKYTVQENLFVGGADDPKVFKFGIVARSSGGDDNIIYKNQFQNMHLGNVAEKNNYDPDKKYKGLKYKCNLNTGNKGHDIYITTQGLGIAKYQGAIGDEANNSFSSTVGTEGHIFNRDQSAKTLVYTHLQNVNNKILAPTKYTPIRVALNPSSSPGSNAQCLTDLEYFHQFIRGRFKTGNGLETVKGNYEQAKTNYINTQYIYGITIDNGNTSGLISQVQSSVPAQMWQLRTQLINSSPLSEDVIVNTIDENALNNTLLYEVLFKNADALRNPEIVQKLQSKKDPMPSYMLNVLLGKTGEISAKDKLLMKLSSYSQQASTAATYVIRHYQADSIYNEGDSLLAWLGKVNTPESNWFKAGYYLNKSNYNAAQQSMTGISGMTKLQQDKHTYLAGFQTLYKTAAQSNMSQLGAPNEGLKIQLAQKAQLESTKEGQSYATNWLRWGEQKVYTTSTIPYPASSGKRSAGNSIQVPYNGEQFNGIIVTPNPAREYINVQFTDLEETSYEFQLLDNLGRVVRRSTLNGPTGNQSIELKQLPTGVYHYRVLWKNQLVTNGKLSLVK